MIVTARVAHGLANQTINETSDFPKKSLRQLRKIENAILRAARKNRTLIEYYGFMYNAVFEQLMQNGFTVTDRSTYDYNLFVISWNKSN